MIGFVCKPSQFVYLFAALREKIEKTRKNKTFITEIYIALNVGCEKGEYFISDEEKPDIHWSLLIIDVGYNIMAAESLCSLFLYHFAFYVGA